MSNQQPSPADKKYQEARDAFLADKRFIDADPDKKKKLADNFVDKIMNPYLQSAYNKTEEELPKYKQKFYDQYLKSSTEDKKKILHFFQKTFRKLSRAIM